MQVRLHPSKNEMRQNVKKFYLVCWLCSSTLWTQTCKNALPLALEHKAGFPWELVEVQLNFFSRQWRYVSVGAQGRASDAGIFAESDFKAALDLGLLNIPEPKPLPGRKFRNTTFQSILQISNSSWIFYYIFFHAVIMINSCQMVSNTTQQLKGWGHVK